ncbi:MAG: ribosome maturation factor RimM [Desulfuromonadales bacterium]|nr:ribosome maturation factor RimM [Desulfuromonadales bacterium]
MQSVDVEPLFPAGVVIGVHGLRGDLKVRPLSGDSTSLDSVQEITLRGKNTNSQHKVEKTSRHKGNLLIHLEGISSIERAETFIGCDVLISHDDLASLPEDEFYWFQLEGLRVNDSQHGDLGRIVEIFTTPAHDILVVHGPRGEVLIPVVDAFILNIDEDAKVMQVDLPEGLVPEVDSDAL